MIGKSTSSLLKKSGIDTIKDLAFFNINELIKVIGINAFNLHLNANGGGDDKVNKSKNIQKSFSIFQTFNKPINNYDDIF
jgi:nucleotidyltransferase/DNA polymerase involved in DNA repair